MRSVERCGVRYGVGRKWESTYLLLEPGDEVVAVLLLLQAGEGHFGTRDVLRRVVTGQ